MTERSGATHFGAAIKRRATVEFLLPFVALAGLFVYLGLSPISALCAAGVWLAVGMTGGWVIQTTVGKVDANQRFLLVVGPGALLGLGLFVLAYLLVLGGWQGIVLCLVLALCGASLWLREHTADAASIASDRATLMALLAGSMLLANSKEFPNLLFPGIGLLLVAAALTASSGLFWRVGCLIVAVAALVFDIVTRPAFWWWSSDDTTTLSGIGTVIVERGRVADVAGWSTGSHHWLLHAWLALWNQLSVGHVFETYLIAWPVVAALSMFASLLLCIELFLGRRASPTVLLVGCVVTAGLVRLEWPAPQEQQPFLFAMIAAASLAFHFAMRGRAPAA